MIRLFTVIFLLMSFSGARAQEGHQIVLLENNNLLPLKGLDTLNIQYDDANLKALGLRYTAN